MIVRKRGTGVQELDNMVVALGEKHLQGYMGGILQGVVCKVELSSAARCCFVV